MPSNKAKVLAVHPRSYAVQLSGGAWHIWSGFDGMTRQNDPRGVIGRGYSSREAWRDAAGRL